MSEKIWPRLCPECFSRDIVDFVDATEDGHCYCNVCKQEIFLSIDYAPMLLSKNTAIQAVVDAGKKITGLCMHDFETIGVGPIVIAKTNSSMWDSYMKNHRAFCEALKEADNGR